MVLPKMACVPIGWQLFTGSKLVESPSIVTILEDAFVNLVSLLGAP